MSVRADLETRLKTWADTRNPPISVVWEGTPFDKTESDAPFLQSFILPAKTLNATLDATKQREVGIFQVSIWGLDGKGSHEVESIADELIELFPVFPKFAETSIDSPMSKTPAQTNNNWRVIHCSASYRR